MDRPALLVPPRVPLLGTLILVPDSPLVYCTAPCVLLHLHRRPRSYRLHVVPPRRLDTALHRFTLYRGDAAAASLLSRCEREFTHIASLRQQAAQRAQLTESAQKVVGASLTALTAGPTNPGLQPAFQTAAASPAPAAPSPAPAVSPVVCHGCLLRSPAASPAPAAAAAQAAPQVPAGAQEGVSSGADVAPQDVTAATAAQQDGAMAVLSQEPSQPDQRGDGATQRGDGDPPSMPLSQQASALPPAPTPPHAHTRVDCTPDPTPTSILRQNIRCRQFRHAGRRVKFSDMLTAVREFSAAGAAAEQEHEQEPAAAPAPTTEPAAAVVTADA